MARKKVVEVSKKNKKVDTKMYQIIKWPLITEKSSNGERDNQYTFAVNDSATKPEIKDAVEAIFEVKVRKVNVSNTRPHDKRVGTHTGIVPGFKKAVVTLLDGYTLDASKRLG